MSNNRVKNITNVTATITAVAILISGTFAWNAFDQKATNKILGEAKTAAGRLHDDFNGQNKDVYIENYSEIGEGGAIYARIRLDEYMEIGDGAGTGTATGTDPIEVLRGDKQKGDNISPVLDDVTTWDTYLYGSDTSTSQIRPFYELSFGGSTIYMPTFNKNTDSLATDINGTLEGPDGDMFSGNDEYADYQIYTEGQEITANATYDLDDNIIDEGEASVEGTNHEIISEKHTAQKTLKSTVMSMQEWKDAGSKVGPYWVYDTDGWAYWAQAIRPQTATGLLLTEVPKIKTPNKDWFYGINVVSQIATADDWGKAEDGDGFFKDGISEDALALLNGAVDRYELTAEFADMELKVDRTASMDGLNWYVLDKKVHNGREMVKIYLNHPDAITPMVFNSSSSMNKWADSPIRNTFLPEWIDNTENLKELIVYDHPDAGVQGYSPALSPDKTGGSYVDSIFLLSIGEYNNLLIDEQRVYKVGTWLRTSGTNSGVMCAGSRGAIDDNVVSTYNRLSIRPVLWIYL